MASPRSLTAFGEKIATVKDQLVSMSEAGTLTRVFDGVPNREEDVEYYLEEMKTMFAEQMTGQKPVEVTLANVDALLKVINRRAQEVILSDPAIVKALNSIEDETKRKACQRDIVVAYTNKLTAKINTDARMAASIERGSVQEKNVKAYMDFVLRVQNAHDQVANVVLSEIRKNASKELVEIMKLSRSALLSKKLNLSGSGEMTPGAGKSASQPGSPLPSPSEEARAREQKAYAKHQAGQRIDRSSPRSALTSSTGSAAAAAAATSPEPQRLRDERRPMERAKSPSPSSMRRK